MIRQSLIDGPFQPLLDRRSALGPSVNRKIIVHAENAEPDDRSQLSDDGSAFILTIGRKTR